MNKEIGANYGDGTGGTMDAPAATTAECSDDDIHSKYSSGRLVQGVSSATGTSNSDVSSRYAAVA